MRVIEAKVVSASSCIGVSYLQMLNSIRWDLLFPLHLCSQSNSLPKASVIFLPGITRILEMRFNDKIHLVQQVRDKLRFLKRNHWDIGRETLYPFKDATLSFLLGDLWLSITQRI